MGISNSPNKTLIDVIREGAFGGTKMAQKSMRKI